MKKKLIRKGVFETNSSSSHSLSLAGDSKEFVYDAIYPDVDGIITLTGGEFGWEWFKHNDALTKANYAAVDFLSSHDRIEMLKEVIMEQTGARDVIITAESDWNSTNHSYIDHDSAGTVPINKSELRDFIFNKNSWLFGGNDNTIADPTFYVVPTYTSNEVIEPLFTHKIKIDGFNYETKFTSNPSNDEIDDALNSLLKSSWIDKNGNFKKGNYWSNDGRFEFETYRKKVDYQNNIIFFVARTDYDAQTIWLEKNPGKTTDWNEVYKISDSLLKDNPEKYIREVKFIITEIK